MDLAPHDLVNAYVWYEVHRACQMVIIVVSMF
uniref:Uncharacterized protein n=1 Tax=Rhizophora mucronata TaxID=61149 RepID=A0A2P2QI39_RHIMU